MNVVITFDSNVGLNVVTTFLRVNKKTLIQRQSRPYLNVRRTLLQRDCASWGANRPYEIIPSDVCGPMQVPSKGGSRYVVTFIDDYSRYATVYCMENKRKV